MSFSLSRRLFLASSAALLDGPRLRAPTRSSPAPTAALIVIDVQNCFVDGGTCR